MKFFRNCLMNRRAKILVIENDMPFALLVVELLRGECDVEIATTAKRGIQLAKTENYDLITLDVDLPDGNGFSLCSRLKQDPHLCDTPIVFMSGRACLEDQQHGLDAGAADYITKPFEIFEFAPRLLSHIKPRTNFHFAAKSESATI
jgi:DNA-binding response OmpR family regulator